MTFRGDMTGQSDWSRAYSVHILEQCILDLYSEVKDNAQKLAPLLTGCHPMP